MRKINTKILRRGDVILTTAQAWESAVIRKATASDISHAMLCVAASSVMDSTGEGVHARNPEKMFYPDACAIHVLRLKAVPPPRVVDTAIEYIRGSTGTSYSAGEAIRSVLPISGKATERQFCSRLVARAYAHAGVQLVSSPDFCTPEDLRRSPLLEPVPDAAIVAAQEDLDFVRQEGDATQGMRGVTNRFLQRARQIEPSIESINDAIEIAINKPEFDAPIADALEASGYLDYWQLEASKFAWRYDFDEMVRFQEMQQQVGGDEILDALREYCEQTIVDDTAGTFRHWQSTLDQLVALLRTYRRKTLVLLHQLYLTLVNQHEKRVSAALAWRDRQGEGRTAG